MQTMHSGVATAMRVLVLLRPRRRFLAISVVFGLVAGLMVSVAVTPAQAASPAQHRTPAPSSAPSPSPAATEPTLRSEPTLVVAVSHKKAKARLAALLAAQQQQLRAARVAQAQ